MGKQNIKISIIVLKYFISILYFVSALHDENFWIFVIHN